MSFPHRSLLLVLLLSLVSLAQKEASPPPNIVYILADDLGYGELGCYGQEKIKTPNIDRLASQGMRFTQHYAGAPVCAPSRCVLMTGQHLARAPIRGNKPVRPEGQWPLPAKSETVAELLQEGGYRCACAGKWGLGPSGSTGDPNDQGFDFFYGYICQREAHNYFPGWLWLNRERRFLNNPRFKPHQRLKKAPKDYRRFRGNEYAPDLILNAALGFVRQNLDRPFFLYLPFVEPHVAMQPPQRWVDQYPKSWDPKPYIGGRGYLPHPRPRAGYAAMISHLDDHVGRVMALLDELGIAENTLLLFSSDNGPTHDVGGVDTKFFESSGGLRGRKGSVYEGGLRVPMIARWPMRIAAGSTSDHISAFQDVMPTLCEVSASPKPKDTDGISFLPTLLGRENQRQHEALVWEFYGYSGLQAVRMGSWKGVRTKLRRGHLEWMLFDLTKDRAETTDVAREHPKIVAQIDAIMARERTPNPDFPIKALDGKKR